MPSYRTATRFNSFASSRLCVFALKVFFLALLLAGGAATVRGQSALDGFDPNANAPVQVVVVQPDGKLIIAGNFTTLAPNGGATVTRNHIARLNPDGSLDTAFNPNANGTLYAVALQTDGKILVGGIFTSIGGQARTNLARLNATTGLADSFNPTSDGTVLTIAVQTDGNILVGGYFTSIGGQLRDYLARLDGTTGLVDSFNANATPGGAVNSVVVQPDGKILVGGVFNSIGGQTRNCIARLDAVTGLADAFTPNANDLVVSIAVQADGKVLAYGFFTSIGGQPRNRLARLDATTGLADSFDPNATGGVFAIAGSIAVQADGKILVGGIFTSIGAQTRNGIARLDATTGLADSFNANVNASNVTVFAIAVQGDGKILVAGNFANIGGQPRINLARLDAATGVADSFNANATGGFYPQILSIVVQADGKILVGGDFTSIGGQTRNNLARLDATTGLADSFNANADGEVWSIAVQADGKILASTWFNSIGGQTRAGFARLSNDTAALQNLTATPTNVTWARGGSSQQFARVTFELSTGDGNYTSLGNGTPSGSNWILTGLNLATRQNLYLRARGYYGNGIRNGSQSIQESVRNVFLATPPPRLNIQRGAPANVVLSWATNVTGFTLESNTNLNANVWSVVSPAPAVSGTNNVVTNAISGPARFYRLRQP